MISCSKEESSASSKNVQWWSFRLINDALPAPYTCLISAQTASVTSFVPALPPRSLVRIPFPQTVSIHCMSLSAACSSPSHRIISAAVQKVPMGFATPFPVMSNAEPWIGSNMLGFCLVGSRLDVGAMPIEPARAAARFVATINKSRSPVLAFRRGDSVPRRILVGRTLAYCWKGWQMASRRPQSEIEAGGVSTWCTNSSKQDGIVLLKLFKSPVGNILS
ncbi:hypothetical protein KC357_g101 [Hortaea werneckii]|nr:hypothetical protein KC357_g101 [Hortaea werneckii]